MNIYVLLVCFVLSYVLVVSLVWAGDREVEAYGTGYFVHVFTLPDGTKAQVVKFDNCVKACLTAGAGWDVEKLYYYGGKVTDYWTHKTLGEWNYKGPLGDFSVAVRHWGETQPYFLNVTRDITGTWHTSITRW